jgi:hypothetical protein
MRLVGIQPVVYRVLQVVGMLEHFGVAGPRRSRAPAGAAGPKLGLNGSGLSG